MEIKGNEQNEKQRHIQILLKSAQEYFSKTKKDKKACEKIKKICNY